MNRPARYELHSCGVNRPSFVITNSTGGGWDAFDSDGIQISDATMKNMLWIWFCTEREKERRERQVKEIRAQIRAANRRKVAT